MRNIVNGLISLKKDKRCLYNKKRRITAMQKTALITGGNSGIGYAVAELLKEKNYRVFISGRNESRVFKAAKELGVEPLIADMGDMNAVKRLASVFAKEGLDILVNNAGTGSHKNMGS